MTSSPQPSAHQACATSAAQGRVREAEGRSRQHPIRGGRALLATAAIAVAVAAADTYVVVLALEEMMAGVGLGIDQLQRATPIVSGFLLGYIAALPLIGRLADLVARQRVLIWCLTLFLLGSIVTALATELPVMVGGRVLQGIGGGGLIPATLALVADALPPGRRGMGLGLVSAVQEVGSVLGPFLGAAILAVASWRAIFYLNAVAALVLAVLIWGLARHRSADVSRASRYSPRSRWLTRIGSVLIAVGFAIVALALWAPDSLTSDITYGPPFVPYQGHTAKLATPIGLWGLGLLFGGIALCAGAWLPLVRRIDVLGALLVTVALGCVVVSFASADASREVMNPQGKWLLALGALCLVGYVVRHRMARDPLVPHGVFNGRVPAALVVSFVVGAALVAVVVEIPVLARLTVANSQTTAAFVLLRFLVAVPIGAFLGGWLLRRAAPRWVAAAGLALTGLGIALMATWRADALTDWVLPTLVLVVTGLGVGLTIAPVNEVALDDADEHAHATASALVVVARMMGMVVGLALMTGVGLHRFSTYLQAIARPGKADITEAGVLQVHTVFTLAAAAALVGAIVAALALGSRFKTTTPPRFRSKTA